MKKRRSLFLLLATTGAMVLLLAGTDGGAYADGRGRRSARHGDHAGGHGHGHRTPCAATAQAAEEACRADATDDYYTVIGSCLNLGDPGDAADCRLEAEDGRREGPGLCRDRLRARLELCDRLGGERHDPEIDPADFLSPQQVAADPNPYFPLVPGNTWIYESEEETITVTVTNETIDILGVTCITVHDVVTEDGEVIEDTLDWYAQDVEGNLWYFGEIARNFEDGLLSDIDGSWTAGRDHAKPGILLPAFPSPGQIYRQEFLLREAEDVAEVIAVDASESSEFADCDGDCLQTLEYTPIEPDVVEYKFYLPDVGMIVEVNPDSGDRTELVDFTTP